jgi:hypothetical protein
VLVGALDFFGICFNLGATDSQYRELVIEKGTEDSCLHDNGTRALILALAGIP